MKVHSEEEIIEKALSKINDKDTEINKDILDIAVDFKDEHDVTHSYIVTLKKETKAGEQEWVSQDITEISTW